MSNQQLTINEVAERIGVGASTLRTWGEKLGVEGHRTSTGKRIYTENDLAVLELIKQLREQDAGFTTIRRQLGGPTVTHGEREATHGEDTVGDGDTAAESPSSHGGPTAFDPSVLIAQVIEAIDSKNDLAERYARVAHQVGTLESDTKHLKEQLAEARQQLAAATEKILLLEAPKPEEPARRRWWPWG